MLDWISSVVPLEVIFGGGLAIIGSVIGASMQHRYARKRNTKETVYRPIFDEAHRIGTHGKLPYDPLTGTFESVYRELDAYQKFYAKNHIGGQMAMVEGNLNSLEKLVSIYQYYLEEVFEGTKYVEFDRDDYVLSVEDNGEAPHKFTTEEWSKYFYIPFVCSEERDELRENLEEYCWENMSEYIVSTENAEEEFLDQAWLALQKAEQSYSTYLMSSSTYGVYKSTKKRARMISKELGRGTLNVFDDDHGEKSNSEEE